jgi:molecular chaperone HscA
MVKNSELLNEEEIAQTKSQIDNLRNAITSKNKDAVQKATEELNEITRPFAERVMDVAIKEAMKGKKIL